MDEYPFLRGLDLYRVSANAVLGWIAQEIECKQWNYFVWKLIYCMMPEGLSTDAVFSLLKGEYTKKVIS